MEKYDYRSAVSEDIREYLKEHDIVVTPINRVEIENKLNEDLMMHDSVTGNASGSYTFNAWQAEENLCHNLGLLQEASEEFCDDLGEWIQKGAETCDVIIRCYLVPLCLSEVLDEVEIEIETLQELADYINDSDEIPDNVSGIVDANNWDDLSGEGTKICRDDYKVLMLDEYGKAIIIEIEED